MAGYCTIHGDQLWYDQAVEGLSDAAHRLLMYCFHGPGQTAIGIRRFTPQDVTARIPSWSLETARGAFAELQKAGLVDYDPDTRLLFVTFYFEHHEFKGVKSIGGAVNALEDLPDSPVLAKPLGHLLGAVHQELGKAPKANTRQELTSLAQVLEARLAKAKGVKLAQPGYPSEVCGADPAQPEYPSEVRGADPGRPEYPSEVCGADPARPEYPSEVRKADPAQPEYPSEVCGADPAQPGYPSEVRKADPAQPGYPSEVCKADPAQPGYPSEVRKADPAQGGCPSEVPAVSPPLSPPRSPPQAPPLTPPLPPPYPPGAGGPGGGQSREVTENGENGSGKSKKGQESRYGHLDQRKR